LTEERKLDHLRICLNEDVESNLVTNGFEDIHFVHRALPELDKNDIDISTEFLDHRFEAPVIVEPMTGGEQSLSKEINAALASMVEEAGMGMGLGSQRAALEDSSLEETYTIVREKAPTAFLMANIGCTQLLSERGIEYAERVIEMVDADALSIHLNPLQEAIQPEGETYFLGVLQRIRDVVKEVKVPVIVKETGAGIASEDARKLAEVGVACIDVAGAGGTSWAAVEHYRAKSNRDELRAKLGKTFWDWGIPTAICLIEVKQSVSIPVIASGGIRTGVEGAKAISLGADLVGMALPFLKATVKGDVKETLNIFLEELKSVMFLVGARNLEELRSAPLVITGKTKVWLNERGFDTKIYARRSG